MTNLEVDNLSTDNQFIKRTLVPIKYTGIAQHMHTYDHFGVCAKGAFMLFEDNPDDYTVVSAGDTVVIKKETYHSLVSLEDNSIWLCIHNADTALGHEALERSLIKGE
jgi:quercetin dioxygenase-like cupin family protein